MPETREHDGREPARCRCGAVLSEAFMAAILAAPHDHGPKLMFADWLAERDERDAEFMWRWLARWGFWPDDRHGGNLPVGHRRAAKPYRFAWWKWGTEKDGSPGGRATGGGRYVARDSRLPRLVFFAMPGTPAYVNHRFYPSIEGALLHLSHGLTLLREVLQT